MGRSRVPTLRDNSEILTELELNIEKSGEASFIKVMRSGFPCKRLMSFEIDNAVPFKVVVDGPVTILIAPRGNALSWPPRQGEVDEPRRGSGGV